jgi:type II secretory pathway pseudopilin PulG
MKIKELISSRKRRLAAAFSIVEATVGMGILATVGGAMMTGITTGFFTMKMARENLRATQIMLEKVETIRLYNWDEINTANYIPANFTNSYDPHNLTAGGTVYLGTMSILNVPFTNSYSTNLKQIVVTLNWTTGSLARSRRLETLVARDGLQTYVY